MRRNAGPVRKMALLVFAAIVMTTPMAIAAMSSSDRVVLRERYPKLSASYETTCGADTIKVSINTKIHLLETYSSKVFERVRQSQVDNLSKIDLTDLKADDLGTTPYYIRAQHGEAEGTIVFGNKKPLRAGILTVFATQTTLYVSTSVPEDHAIICSKGAEDIKETTDEKAPIKVKTIGDNCLKVWGIVVFKVNITKDSGYKSLTGTLVPDITPETQILMIRARLGVLAIPDAASPKK